MPTMCYQRPTWKPPKADVAFICKYPNLFQYYFLFTQDIVLIGHIGKNNETFYCSLKPNNLDIKSVTSLT